MKSYEEMARYVLEVRDEHERKREKRKRMIRRYAPVAASLCAVLLISLGAWKNMPSPNHSHDDFTTPVTTSENTVTAPVSSSGVKQTTTSVTLTPSASSTATTATTAFFSEHVLTKTNQSAHTTTTAVRTFTTAAKTQIVTVTVTTHTEETFQNEQTSSTLSVTAATTVTSTNMPTAPLTIPQETTVTETTTIKAGSGTNPQEYQSIEQMYNMAYLSTIGGKYTCVGVKVNYKEVEGFIEEADMSGINSAEELHYTCKAAAYCIDGADSEKVIAIKFDGYDEYYLYCRTAD